jgi:hypothetical protein
MDAYPELAVDPTDEELTRDWTPSVADLDEMHRCRGDDNRHRFAMQLCALGRRAGSLILVLSIAGSSVAFADAAIRPQIFAPGVISGPANDMAPAFTPDGDTVYVGQGTAVQSAIMVSRRSRGAWSQPQIAPFSGSWYDMEPAMAPDGTYLVFVSNRPTAAGGRAIETFYYGARQIGGNLWIVRRQGSGWSSPVRLPDTINTNTSTWTPSIAADGSLYFMTNDASTGNFRIYRSELRGGAYQRAQPLPFSDGHANDVDPAVSADQSFLIFSSDRSSPGPPGKPGTEHLFIVFQRNGTWGVPVAMQFAGSGDVTSDIEPRLSPDQRTLYFSSRRMLPATTPRDRARAEADVTRMLAWDNGSANIWFVPLAPWLSAAPR